MTARSTPRLITPQLALGWREPATHGGARPGAGRPRKVLAKGEARPLEHDTRPSHRKGDPVHVTVRVMKGVPSLRAQSLQNIVKRSLLRHRETMAKKEATYFQLVHFSIQSNHVHLIVEANDKRSVARGVMGIEIRIARSINKLLHRRGRFWADRYHRHDLRTPSETRNALRYVLLDARKHRAALDDTADPASSAPSFDGFSRPARIRADSLAWPRVVPRTWLLETGWRRRGLIDPAGIA